MLRFVAVFFCFACSSSAQTIALDDDENEAGASGEGVAGAVAGTNGGRAPAAEGGRAAAGELSAGGSAAGSGSSLAGADSGGSSTGGRGGDVAGQDAGGAGGGGQAGRAHSGGGGAGGAGCGPFPMMLCDGKCVDVSADRLNCGGCGISCHCDEVCGAGYVCNAPPGARYLYCEDQATSEKSCVDSWSDEANCGACGERCTGGTSVCWGPDTLPGATEGVCGWPDAG